MRLEWQEVRARAAAFSQRHALTRRENGDTQTFYNEFFACFGVDRKQVAVYEQRVRNLPGDRQGFIDLFMPGVLIVEQKSAGLDLRAANDQALNYHDWLPESQRPRYILTCDFQRWRLLDLVGNREWRFALPDLKKKVELFAFIVGVQPRHFRNQQPANPKASELLGKLHRQLEEDGYSGHKLQLLLVRLLFILFADDTGIWPKDRFLTFLEQQTRPDGRDLGEKLAALFDVLDTAPDHRQRALDPDLAAFPHINGRLFAERIGTASFDKALREILLDASAFDWGTVSPAIFGALFESVIDKVTRRKQGAHYTPEEAIQKLIGPLFLDDLYVEFEALRARKDGGRDKALTAFHDRLATLTFLDPACGAGNFLVVTYRELRELERLVLKELHVARFHDVQTVLAIETLSKLNVDNFYGIEIDEFPSQITQVALWMTDHIANTNLGDDFGRPFARVPLVTAPSIRHGDALEIDWASILPPQRCSYVLGNPPFVGAKMQSAAQRAQVRRIARLGGSGGTLDYVAAWFLKAAAYVQGAGAGERVGATSPATDATQPAPRGRGHDAAPSTRIGFVATNSITQGEQVAQLWPKLFAAGLEIGFAHRTFVWPGRAAVHCVIVGLAQRGDAPAEKRLFSYPDPKGAAVETRTEWLTAYLFDPSTADRHLVVREIARPVGGAPKLINGSQPIDGGNYIFGPARRDAFISKEPAAAYLLKPLIGAEEFINGGERWILDLHDVPPNELRTLPEVRRLIRAVREFRSASPRKQTLAAANTPQAFGLRVVPKASWLLLPKVSSERRSYMPIGRIEPPAIPTDLVFVLADATLYDFAILTSAMHMAWLRHIGGRLESRYRYSIGLVYNTFPWPDATPAQRAKIEALAQAVLDARALPKNATASLADLYDPDRMPAELFRAHKALDAAVDRLYAAKGFADDRARVEHLFRRYEVLVTPTAGAAQANRRTRRRVGRAAANGTGDETSG